MDDGLVLNLANDGGGTTRRGNVVDKGGRWTDRVKAKRVAKRKNTGTRPSKIDVDAAHNETAVDLDENPRLSKKPRKDAAGQQGSRNSLSERGTNAKQPSTNRQSQVVSSLFTSNPKVEDLEQSSTSRPTGKPSNAPLTDQSTFAGLGVDPLIVTHLSSKMSIHTPTSIQREALSALLSKNGEDMSDRDAFIQSQTGSGKTLSYLLPILHDLLPLSSLSYIDRSIGTLALIIAPTRELAKQISDVLEQLLSLRLRPQGESVDESLSATRLTRWMVSGLLIGGENRAHEKARLRKGLPFLVATPGRLLDHLQNTSSFNVGKCRWLILDEADRLMELGFEESIRGILQALEGRRKLSVQAIEEEKSTEVGGWDWQRRRRTILCSATIREDVQALAGTALIKPVIVKGTEVDAKTNIAAAPAPGEVTISQLDTNEKFTPPSQLSQKYIITPLKLRLVTLVSLLRMLLAQSRSRRGTKIIIFLSCTDAVDFHWKLFGSSSIDESASDIQKDDADSEDEPVNGDDDSSGDVEPKPRKRTNETFALQSPLLPDTLSYRLHGSLPLPTRLASLKGFSSPPNAKFSSSVLFCTSVASRGLDLPLVRAVIQYDLPTEGGATEYVHRVGRTARAGKGGEAWSFVSPSERDWIPWIEERIRDSGAEEIAQIGVRKGRGSSLVPVSVESVMRGGFGGKGTEFEARATQVQLAFERWVLNGTDHAELAKKAFQSHMRAYATHPSDEKHIFHIRHLHIGHLAKAFALREAPSNIGQKANLGRQDRAIRKPGKESKNATSRASTVLGRAKGAKRKDVLEDHDASAEQRMQDVVRAQGRLSKKGGIMMVTGASEFHVAGGADLEKLVSLG